MAHLSKKSPLYPYYEPTKPTRSFSCGRGYPVRYDMTTLSKVYKTGTYQRSRHHKHRLSSEKKPASENLHRIDLIAAVDDFKHMFTTKIRGERELFDLFACQAPYSRMHDLVYFDREADNAIELSRDRLYDDKGVVKEQTVPPTLYNAYISLFEANWCGEPIPFTQDGTEPVSSLYKGKGLLQLSRRLKELHVAYGVPMYQGWKWGVWVVDKWDDNLKDVVPRKYTNQRPILYRKEIVHLVTHSDHNMFHSVPKTGRIREVENLAYDYGLYEPDCYPYLQPHRLRNPLDYRQYLEHRLSNRKILEAEDLWELNEMFPDLARKYNKPFDEPLGALRLYPSRLTYDVWPKIPFRV